MYIITYHLFIIVLILKFVSTTDVCTEKQCTCDESSTNVNCDSKSWSNLDQFEFPSTVSKLTLNNNNLKFDTGKQMIDFE